MKVGTILLDASSGPLRDYDRRLREELGKSGPDDFAQANERRDEVQADVAGLRETYRALIIAESGRVRESRESLKKVIEGASAPQIRAIAMRFLISSLYMDAVTDRDNRDEIEWQTEERECREYANLALRECSEEGWGLAVRFIARTALGVLDYYSDDTAIARIHLSDAEKLYARDRKLCELGTSVHVGFAFFTLGQILQLSGDFERASAYYKRALEKVDGTLRIAVLCFLSSALLEGNKNREAQSIAAKGLRELGPNGARALKDDLQCNLADALARLGDAKGARTLLTEVVDVGVVESMREWARKALEVLGVDQRTV